MTVLSIPAVSSRIAAVCLSTWGDILGGQAGAEHRGCRGVLRQPRRDGVAAHPGSGSGGEYESFSVTWLFGDERRQDLHGLPVQGCGSVLAAFAVLCRALVYAELPSERCRFALRAGRIAAVEPRAARHNQRPSRKASSVSGAR